MFLCLSTLGNVPVAAATSSKSPTHLPIPKATFTLQQFLQQKQPQKAPDAPQILYKGVPTTPRGVTVPKKSTLQPLSSTQPATMNTVSQSLPSSTLANTLTPVGTNTHTTQPLLHLIGRDSLGPRLEVVIPSGAIDLSQATTINRRAPQGALTITITQQHGHFVGVTNELGSFQIQVTDGKGLVVHGIRLRIPIDIIYHYRSKELSLMDLNPSHLLLVWSDVLASTKKTSAIGKAAVIAMQNNAATSTLTAHSLVLATSTVAVGVSDPDNQTPTKPRFASVQGNNGQLSYSYPLTLAPGPKGTVPQLAATYSNAASNGRSSPRSPADNVGEGWALTMGSVSQSKEAGGAVWYFINGVDNVSDRLIPDSSTVQVGTNFATEHLSYVKVTMVNAGFDSQQCFHVWDTAGNYYEFGCTPGSLQYYTDSNNNRTNYRYDLDQMIPANDGVGNTTRVLNITYLHDAGTDENGNYTITDAVPQQITYGTSTATDLANHITTTIAGTVDFLYQGVNNNISNGVQWVTAYGTNEGGCTPPDGLSTTARCDDPVTDIGGLAAPLVMSTFSLQTIKTYVGNDSSPSHLDYSYNFSYQDTPFVTCSDALTGMSTYCAGNHLLTSITPTVYQNGVGTALPGVTFGYNDPVTEQRTNKYEDTGNIPYGTQDYQVQTNWRYLTSYHDHSNGVGEKIVYHTAYNNSNGTPLTSDGDNRYDPFFCVWHSSNCGPGTAFYPMDNKMWTQQIVYQISATGTDSSASSLTPATTTYHYLLEKTAGTCAADTASPPDTDCVGFGWIPSTSDGWQDFYHGEFRGFGEVDITHPDGTLTVQKYYATEGWDTAQSDAPNYLSGQQYEEDVYQGGVINSATLLQQIFNTYAGTGSTATSCASGYVAGYYKPCEVTLLSTRRTQYEQTGSSNSNAPWIQQDVTYDDYMSSSGWIAGGYHNPTKQVISSSNAPTVTNNMTYTVTNTTVGGQVYYNVHQIAHSELVDANNHTWQCQDTTYDEGVGTGIPQPAAGWPTTVKAYSTCGTSSTAIKTYTGYDANGNAIATVDGVGTTTPSLYISNGCTLTTAPAIITPSSNWNAGRYTSCMGYNGTNALPTDTWNAFSQHTTITYDAMQGLVPISMTDVNSQVTTTSYDYTGGNTSAKISMPGELDSYTALSSQHSSCTDSSTLPCFEIDSAKSLYSSAITRKFYDGLGREVETLTAGPGSSQSTVVYTIYNDSANSVFKSQPFVVANRTIWLDPNDPSASSIGGIATYQDALGRTLAVKDALFQSGSNFGIVCPSLGGTRATTCTIYSLGSVNGDSHTYALTTTIDANDHVQTSYNDALTIDKVTRTRYTLTYSGIYSGTLTGNTLTTIQYNALDKPTSVTVTDLMPQNGQAVTSVTTTSQYDDLGRMTILNDPDRGIHTYGYDANGQVISDISGTHTLGSSYDLLGRVGCIQDAIPTPNSQGNCSSGVNPFVRNIYDVNPSGVTWTNYPIGKLTQSVAINYEPGPDYTQGIVTENMRYDQRGQLITERMQINASGGSLAFPILPQYQASLSYNNADQLTTTQTTIGGQTGYTFTKVYDGITGVPIGLSNTATGTVTLAGLSYNNNAQISDFILKDTANTNLVDTQFQYDGDLRPASATTKWTSSNTIISSDGIQYDPLGNVISHATTQVAVSGNSGSGGIEIQNFCYDEQNRLVWASNVTLPTMGSGQSCGSTPLSGVLGGNYTNNYVYTHLGQLWQSPFNGDGAQQQYLYCSNGHPHQVTNLALSSSNPTCTTQANTTYQASYNVWGDMTSRMASSAPTSTLAYDGQDHLMRWNGTTASNVEEAWYLYDAAGNRVLSRTAVAATGGNPAIAAGTITVYAFGLEEHQYQYVGLGSSATNNGNIYYYTLGGRLIGMLTGTSTLTTNFLFTDLLGSVVTSVSNTAGNTVVLANQTYGPYGNKRYSAGSIGTAKGYTGQYSDDLSGLDFYNARYYDPLVGRFVSADTVESNSKGMDPYEYVGGNPETRTDPTGHSWWDTFQAWTRYYYYRYSTPSWAMEYSPFLQGEDYYHWNAVLMAQNIRQYRLIPGNNDTNHNLADALMYWVTPFHQRLPPQFVTLYPEYGSGANGPYGGHSEQHIMNDLRDRVIQSLATINCFCHGGAKGWELHVTLFSEKAPCGSYSANCQGLLNNEYRILQSLLSVYKASFHMSVWIRAKQVRGRIFLPIDAGWNDVMRYKNYG